MYDADLQGYFDTIPHDQLLACLRLRIADRSVWHLLCLGLQAPVVEHTEDNPTKGSRPRQGTPQGGVVSPLLANLYLPFRPPEGRSWYPHLAHLGFVEI